MTSPALTEVDAAIAQLEGELTTLRAARAVLAGRAPLGPSTHELDEDPGRVEPRKRFADGTLEHRILVACGEPTSLAAIVESAGARKPDVKKAVAALVKSGHLEPLGAGRGTKYQRA